MAYQPAPDNREPIKVEWENEYPSLSAVTLHGGMPGLTYHLVHSANIGLAQTRGLKLVAGMPVYIIKGPSGIASAQMFCEGEPIPGANANSSVRPYFIDPRLDAETGITPRGPYGEKTVVQDPVREGEEDPPTRRGERTPADQKAEGAVRSSGGPQSNVP